MHKLFYPESIVIIGLSAKPTNISRSTLENLLRWGYRGRLFGVNPGSNDIYVDGIRMYKKKIYRNSRPGILFDSAVCSGMVEQCGKFGIKRMAIPTAGFSGV